MAWRISGSLFTGNVVTVGVGNDYATINDAIDGTTGALLMILEAGTYPLQTIRSPNYREVYIKGRASSAADVVITPAQTNAVIHLDNSLTPAFAKLMVEGCTLDNSSGYAPHVYHAHSFSGEHHDLIFNKCVLNGHPTGVNWQSIVSAYGAGTKFDVLFRYCKINVTPTSFGCLCASTNYYSDPWNLLNSEIIKCVTNSINTKYCVGSFWLTDYRSIDTDLYGPDFGTFFINPIPNIPAIEHHYKQMRGHR